MQFYADGEHDDADMQKDDTSQYTCSLAPGIVFHSSHHHPAPLLRTVGSGDLSGCERPHLSRRDDSYSVDSFQRDEQF